MKSEKEIEQDIIKVTMEIKNEFPELYKHILEMPLRITDKNNLEVNRKSLKEYYNSLEELFNKYRNGIENEK